MKSRRLCPLFATLALAVLLAGCESTRSFERTAGGETVFLDELNEQEKQAARKSVVEGLRRSAEVFELSVGDQVEIFYHKQRNTLRQNYVIKTGDKISLEFENDPDKNREERVRPDGRISYPFLGEILVAGMTVGGLKRELSKRYASILPNPIITINVAELETALDDFDDVVGTTTVGRRMESTVNPDGTISIPLLEPIPARGRTVVDLKSSIDNAYREIGLDVTVSVIPTSITPGRVAVIGEVLSPGMLDSNKPETVLTAVASAGGVTLAGSLANVRVFYIDDDNLPRVRAVNLKNVLYYARIEEDMVLPDNSVIYVPPTMIAKTGRFMDAVVQDILRFNGMSLGFSWILESGSDSGSGVQTITVP